MKYEADNELKKTTVTYHLFTSYFNVMHDQLCCVSL